MAGSRAIFFTELPLRANHDSDKAPITMHTHHIEDDALACRMGPRSASEAIESNLDFHGDWDKFWRRFDVPLGSELARTRFMKKRVWSTSGDGEMEGVALEAAVAEQKGRFDGRPLYLRRKGKNGPNPYGPVRRTRPQPQSEIAVPVIGELAPTLRAADVFEEDSVSPLRLPPPQQATLVKPTESTSKRQDPEVWMDKVRQRVARRRMAEAADKAPTGPFSADEPQATAGPDAGLTGHDGFDKVLRRIWGQP